MGMVLDQKLLEASSPVLALTSPLLVRLSLDGAFAEIWELSTENWELRTFLGTRY